MRSKVTVVLLFLNVLLFYYIFQFERIVPPDSNGRHVNGPEIASADSLVRTGKTGAPVRLERRGENWWLTQPYEWPANPNAMQRMLNELKFLEYDTKFPVAELGKSGLSLATYGLDQPALTLTFTSANKPYTLKIGDDSKISNRLYLLSSDEKNIYVVGRSLAESVGLPLEDLRAASIFTVPVFEVRSLNVQTPALKLRLRREGTGRWAFESPIQTRASKSAVEVTVNALNALVAKTFLEPAASDLERTGLNSPALRVTLEGNARRETLLLGGAAADGVYFAKIEDKAVVFTVPVPSPLLEVLRAAQDALRDRRVLDFEPHSVTALTLAAPGRPELTLQRLEAGAGAAAWQVVVRVSGQAPQTSPADTALVEELLQKLYLLAATQFLSDAPSAAVLENYGFNRPEREITLSLNTGGGPHGTDAMTAGLQIGVATDKKDVAYAKDTNLPFVYQILPDILEEAPALALHYRQRLLRDLPEGAKIQGLTLTDTASGTAVYDRHLAEATATWDATLTGEPEARRKAVTALLAQLRRLRAKRFTADTFNPDHADTALGPRPWRYRLDLSLSLAGGNAAAQSSTSTLFLTERLSGNAQLAGTAEFGGVVFEVSQELLDALFTLIYREKNDPGQAPPAVETPAAKTDATATKPEPTAPKAEPSAPTAPGKP